jgi:hypothetical protein
MSAAPIQLDFVRTAPASRWRWLLLALAVALLLPVSDAGLEALEQRDAAQERLERAQRHDQQRQRRAGAAERAPDPQDLAGAQRANAMIDQLTVPWDELFATLEGTDTRGVAVLSLTPNARDRSLRLAGEARSLDELFAYVSRLAQRPALAQVHLLGYSTVVKNGVSLVSFTLAASWKAVP